MIEEKKKSKTRIKVRYAETDAMGIVHHANYYVYFEAAREDLVSLCGITYKDIEEMGIMMPIIETQCRYYQPARYADLLMIETEIETLTPAKLVLNYSIVEEASGKLVAKGKTVQAFVEQKNFRLVNIKKTYPDLWMKINSI